MARGTGTAGSIRSRRSGLSAYLFTNASTSDPKVRHQIVTHGLIVDVMFEPGFHIRRPGGIVADLAAGQGTVRGYARPVTGKILTEAIDGALGHGAVGCVLAANDCEKARLIFDD